MEAAALAVSGGVLVYSAILAYIHYFSDDGSEI